MSNDKKIAIIIGLITSAIFVYIFDPICRLLWRLLSWGCSGTVDWFLESTIRKASLGVANDSALMVMTIVFGLFIGATFGITAIKIHSPIADKPKSDKKSRRISFMLYLSLAGFVVCQGLVISQTWMTQKYITSFNQHIAILSPHVSAATVLEWRSKWACMQGLEDYRNLYQELSKASNQNNVILPDNPTYTLTTL